MSDDDPRKIFVAHPWTGSPEANIFRNVLAGIGHELGVDFVFPEEQSGWEGPRLEKSLADAALSIFDLSQWNPNVAYEYGVANGLDVPLIALLRNDGGRFEGPASLQGSAQVRYSGFDELAALLAPVIRQHVGSRTASPVSLHSSPGGGSRPAVTTEVLELLQRGDNARLREFAALERERFRSKLLSSLDFFSRRNDLRGFGDAISPQLERYLGWLLPLVDHRSPILEDELRLLGRLHGSQPLQSGVRSWTSMNGWVTWWIANAVGAFALFTDNLQAIDNLFHAPVDDGRSFRVLATVMPEVGGTNLSGLRLSETTGREFRDPPIHYLNQSLSTSALFSEWNSSFAHEETSGALRWLADYNFLGCLYAGREGSLMTASWADIDGGGESIAKRIHDDRVFCEELSMIFRVSPEELVSSVPQWLEEILERSVPGRMVVSEALAPWQRT